MEEDKRARDAEKALRERMRDDKYRAVQIDIKFGDPGHRIADLAKELKTDLIVMPSHGRTGLSHLLIGSVAERITRLSHCPVLILRK
jgi:nucleotide-binding universal stress UspA family protein